MGKQSRSKIRTHLSVRHHLGRARGARGEVDLDDLVTTSLNLGEVLVALGLNEVIKRDPTELVDQSLAFLRLLAGLSLHEYFEFDLRTVYVRFPG